MEGCRSAGCDGDDVTVYNCCPSEELEPDAFNARHRRTLRRVALVDGPRVIARAGDGCSAGECSVGADILTVEWVMTAAKPWLWTDPRPVLDVAVPTDDGSSCITWCLHDAADPEPEPPEPTTGVCVELTESCPPGSTGVEFVDVGACAAVAWPDVPDEPDPEPEPDPCTGTCHLADCPDLTVGCADPSCKPPPPPVPVQPQTCFCRSIAANDACYDLDLTGYAAWSAHALMITVEAGSSDLRRLTIAVYERTSEHDGLTCAEIAEQERCNPYSVIEVAYVPAGGTLTLDGQIGRAIVECGGVRETSTDVYGRDGAPVSWRLLNCRSSRFCVCVSADALFLPASDASIEVAVTGRGY